MEPGFTGYLQGKFPQERNDDENFRKTFVTS